MNAEWIERLKTQLGLRGSTAMRRNSVQCLSSGQLHRMSYTEFGDPCNPRVLVCVHGLTRNCRDFDDLALALSCRYRVVCPDVAGRGLSDWLTNKADYAMPVYVQHMICLIARLGVEHVEWLGTSMGGLIGMALASLSQSPIRKLVLNDVGPILSAKALQRIAEYVGCAPVFPTLEGSIAYIKAISADFGDLSESQWRHIALHSVVQGSEGWKMRYDPAIGEVMRATPLAGDIAVWPVYDQISCPTLVMRGARSDLLLRATAEEMTRRGPRASFVEVPAVGHAPMLMDNSQIEVVRRFLLDR